MKKYKLVYVIGGIILFLGMLWMFLPHTAHEALTHEVNESHLTHTIQGAIVILIGLFILQYSSKKQKLQKKSL